MELLGVILEEHMSKAYEIFDAAFSKPRDPRSAEYRHGVIDILKFRLRETNEATGKRQYRLGTAQADAYFAGCDEGHRLARGYLDEQERQFSHAERQIQTGGY
jgi:hypothetical protein